MAVEGANRYTSGEVIAYTCIIITLVLISGITAGLQVALYSIDQLLLRVLRTTGTAKERWQADRLLRVLDLQHWPLVAMILLNASAMMTLPIILENMFDQLTALIISTTAVLFLGEVLPLSVFVRWPIPICAALAPLLWFAVIISSPISYPVGKLLDRLLGHRDEILAREELAALILAPQVVEMTAAQEGNDTARELVNELPSLHGERTHSHHLQPSEIRMLQGTMNLSVSTVADCLRTHATDVFMVSSATILDKKNLCSILLSGYSRIPVYFCEDRAHIVGVLIVDSLVALCYTNPNPPPAVGDCLLREVLRIASTASLIEAYRAFHRESVGMAVIYGVYGQMVGILTYTDVLANLQHIDTDTDNTTAVSSLRRHWKERVVERINDVKYFTAVRQQAMQHNRCTDVRVCPPSVDDSHTLVVNDKPYHQ